MPTGLIGDFEIFRAGVFCEIGDFVLMKATLARKGHKLLKHIARQIFVHLKLTRLQLLVQRGVLFVNDLVAGKMFRLQVGRFAQGGLPNFHRLRGNGEHQIKIDALEARRAEAVVRLENHLARMHAAEALQQIGVERLHAHRDAVHTRSTQ